MTSTSATASGATQGKRKKAARFRRWLAGWWNLNLLLGLVSIGSLAFLWEFARPLGIPALSSVPPPSEVIRASANLLGSRLYWDGWMLSVQRITLGFLAAQIVGIPLGLIMAMHRNRIRHDVSDCRDPASDSTGRVDPGLDRVLADARTERRFHRVPGRVLGRAAQHDRRCFQCRSELQTGRPFTRFDATRSCSGASSFRRRSRRS